MKSERDKIDDFSDLVDLLDRAIDPEASALMKEGGYIKKGFNSELDDYRNAKTLGKDWLKELQDKEIEATGIKNLKILNNKVFGYFIEVNRSQIDKVPMRYIRKQTVANNERYITEDLKAIEEKIMGSEEKALKLESLLYAKIKEYLSSFVKQIQKTASAIAVIDALLALSEDAVKYGYTRPTISNQTKHIKIIDGRHPVVEAFQREGNFIANDTMLNSSTDRIMIITGPNMAGKSTYMRLLWHILEVLFQQRVQRLP